MKLFNGDCLEVMRGMADNSVDAVITDPPYFQIKGKFDWDYKDFNHYLELFEQCAIEWKRILKASGCLLVFGHAKRIAYKQIILDKYFNLENSLVWEKSDCQTIKGVNAFRSFIPITERALYYSLERNKTGLEEIHDNHDCFKSIKEYMRGEREKIMQAKGFKTFAEFNCYINEVTNTASVVSRHYFIDSQWHFPTAEIYEKLQTTGFFTCEYESLRSEYESLRRPFNNVFQLTDVIKHSQESHISKTIAHDTVKPLGLMSKLIETITRENNLILDPFMGSGTTGVACERLNRRFIGIEKVAEYFEIAQRRIQHAQQQTETQPMQLFGNS